MVASDGARCAAHPSAPAAEVCVRCGTFVCRACRCLDIKSDSYCPACYARLDRRSTASKFAFIAAVAGFLGLGCFPLGLVAAVCGVIDLVRIASGSSPTGGKMLSTVGLLLGLAGLGLGAILVAQNLGGNPSRFDLP